MKFNLKKTALLFTGVVASCQLFAQKAPDSTKTIQSTTNYVQPFSPENAFRTWSIGINVGVLTPYNFTQDKRSMDFSSPNGELGYSANIKKQILSSFGLQLNFMAGKLSGDHAQPNATGYSPYY